MQTSRGKLDRLHRTPAESTAPALVVGTLRIRARSSDQDCLIFGFCPSGRGFASALLSDGSSRQPPLRLASPLSHQTWAETLTSTLSNILGTHVPVDAQNASTATWKTADSFPQAPTPIIFLGGRNKNGRATGNHTKLLPMSLD